MAANNSVNNTSVSSCEGGRGRRLMQEVPLPRTHHTPAPFEGRCKHDYCLLPVTGATVGAAGGTLACKEISVSSFPGESCVSERRSERCIHAASGPEQKTTTTTTTEEAMDAVVKASFASLSVSAVVAHRLLAAGTGGTVAAERDDGVEGRKRKEYEALRKRYFGAYFFALFGNRIYTLAVISCISGGDPHAAFCSIQVRAKKFTLRKMSFLF